MTRMLQFIGIICVSLQISLVEARRPEKPEPCNIPRDTVMRSVSSVGGYKIELIPYMHFAALQLQHSTLEYTVIIPLEHPQRRHRNHDNHEGHHPHKGKPSHGQHKPHHGKPHHNKQHHRGHHPHKRPPHPPVACKGNILKWKWQESTPPGLKGEIEVEFIPSLKEMRGKATVKSNAVQETRDIRMVPYVQ